jgi:hypothetical protein
VSLPPFAEALSIGEALHHFESHPAVRYDVDIISAIDLETGDRVVFGINIPVLTARRKNAKAGDYPPPGTLPEDLLQTIMGEPAAQIVLQEFREAMGFAIGTGFHCYRAIEAMMQSIRTSDSEKETTAWDRLRQHLRLERGAIDFVKEHALRVGGRGFHVAGRGFHVGGRSYAHSGLGAHHFAGSTARGRGIAGRGFAGRGFAGRNVAGAAAAAGARRRPKGRLRQLLGSAPAPLRACARHHSSCVTVEVQFITSAGCLNYPCRTPIAGGNSAMSDETDPDKRALKKRRTGARLLGAPAANRPVRYGLFAAALLSSVIAVAGAGTSGKTPIGF